jgi:hypothetical protein
MKFIEWVFGLLGCRQVNVSRSPCPGEFYGFLLSDEGYFSIKKYGGVCFLGVVR